MWTNWLDPALLNTVHCMDCLEFMKGLPDGCIDLVLTDPPYWMEFQSNHRKEKHIVIENDNNLDWVEKFVKETARVIKVDWHVYLFFSHHNIDIVLWYVKKHLRYKSILIREKNNTWMGDLEWDYAPKFEFIIFCWGKKLNNWRDANILKFDRTDNELHPTQKPVVLMKYLLEKSSKKGETVLDCFAWSWTTGVACKELWRNYILVEKEPKYVDIIHKRLQNTTVSLFHS